jgi:hypothetical protein
MTTKFSPGDILTISTASYKGRKFTVVESSSHRTGLRGARGARRTLACRFTGKDVDGVSGEEYWIHEDDGERNRGRPCTVDEVETAPPRQEPAPPKPALTRHRPITAMEIAMLMKCETASDVAAWVIERDRASTSGSKCGVITTIVAMLAAIGRGDRRLALDLARNVVISLEQDHYRMPPERLGNSAFDLKSRIDSGEITDRESAMTRMEWTREYLDEVAARLDSVPWS